MILCSIPLTRLCLGYLIAAGSCSKKGGCMKRTDKLGFKLGLLFGIFLLAILLLSGLTTYYGQMSIYEKQCEENIRNLSNYLVSLMTRDGEDFILYQNYYLEHYADVNIPIDADEYLTAQSEYEELFAKNYPGKAIGVDIEFEDMSEEVKLAHLVYTHLYWLLTFEQARIDFKLPYTYYLVMDEENHNVTYMIDGERTSRAGHLEFIKENPEYQPFHHEQGSEAEYMYLHDEYHNDPEKYPVEWAAWKTGEKPEGYQKWANEWGNTYAYYTPLIIDGQKLGLVGVEVEVADFNAAIMNNTLRQLGMIAIIMTIGVLALIFLINRVYINKIVRLEANVKDYTLTRDAAVAEEIRRNIRGKDEISSLSKGVVSLILDIQDYIRSLTQTHRELDEANDTAAKMQDLANKDALTGVRSMTAYEYESAKLDERLQNEPMEFAIAMIDLNDLKQINDTYGHEKGNIALKKLCDTICQIFQHSMVFRIGGDEFVVTIVNQDYPNRDALVKKFRGILEDLKKDKMLLPWEKVSAAIGVSAYDASTDTDVESVFKRADDLMYKNKKEMKAAV